MLTLAAVAAAGKLVAAIGAGLLGLLGLLGIVYAGGNRAGQRSRDNTLAHDVAKLQREIARADAAGPRSRRDVLDRLRRGGF